MANGGKGSRGTYKQAVKDEPAENILVTIEKYANEATPTKEEVDANGGILFQQQ